MVDSTAWDFNITVNTPKRTGSSEALAMQRREGISSISHY